MQIINTFLMAIACAVSVQASSPKLPPLSRGVTDLKFGEFFVTPIGPEGLTFTDKLRGLDGKRVRMLGYMVEQDKSVPGRFIFSALPVQLHDHDAALADDLPPAVVYVTVPTLRDQPVSHVRGLMLLTGSLKVGSRDEPDGRVSLVRLELDPPRTFATWWRRLISPGSSRRNTFPQTTHK